MGAAKLYCRPLAGNGTQGTLEKISVPTLLGYSALDESDLRARREGIPSVGVVRVATYGASRVLRIVISQINATDNSAFLDRLDSLSTQMDAGAILHFATDSDKAGAWSVTTAALGTTETAPAQGDTSGYWGTELLSLETSPALAADDRVSILTAPPESHRHVGRLDSWNSGGSGNWALTQGVFFSSSMSQAIITARDSWYFLTPDPQAIGAARLIRGIGNNLWRWDSGPLVTQPQRLFNQIS
jgi:hypothetical protein